MRNLKTGKCEKPKKQIDRKTLARIRAMTLPQLKAFLENFYENAFKDGANADVDPNIKYVAIKKGVTYECGNCGAILTLDESMEEENCYK